MKKLFFLLTIILMLVACTPLASDNQTAIAQTQAAWTQIPAVSQETLQPFRFGDLVGSESHALIAAKSGLRASFDYSEPLTVVKVKQMSYGEYRKFIGGTNDRQADMQVWLIIYFDDKWQAIGPLSRVTPNPSFRGCVSVAINAADGLPLEVDGPLQLGIITECDK